MSNPDGYFGTLSDERKTSQYNALSYVVRAILSGRANIGLVQVQSVTPGTPQSSGTVDVQPMVNQLGADGTPMPHGIINNIPWMILQAGGNAVLMQPEVGDIGVCLFADRDISSVKSTRAIGNPGSLRQDDMADGLYIGGFLNNDATQWIKFDSTGIIIHSPTKIRLEAPLIEIVAPTINVTASTGFNVTSPTSTFNGDMHSTGTITGDTNVIGGGKSLKTHTHSGVVPGGGTSGPPV